MGRNCGKKKLVAHTGLEPVISALRGQRVNQLHQCATVGTLDYRGRLGEPASLIDLRVQALALTTIQDDNLKVEL